MDDAELIKSVAEAAGWPVTPYTGGSGFYSLHHGTLLLALNSGEWSLHGLNGDRRQGGVGEVALAAALDGVRGFRLRPAGAEVGNDAVDCRQLLA